ncbi:hypothetical protein FHT08_000610 [Xanthomonas campestris]|uniref:cupin domain-containing protein n=1 Tax=Xanthomonas sp. CFBP 8151 TaxID=3035310 RepID=UPI00141B7343|nr:cupin domain-containing protein [Xanthomonas sp. CFBP 8151]MEB1611129.1 cupin domain-containing protein [Xanthomonas campestris pv. campestris]NIJ75562.1 hypothetical protein [Xanthomonas sp. CFBP 8151]
MKLRRIVAGTDHDGTSRVFADGDPPRSVTFDAAPGFHVSLLWSAPALPAVGRGEPADTTRTDGVLPAHGQSRLLVVTLPPDSTLTRADFDAAAYGQELAAKLPGFAETFEPDCPGMHTTDSVDYDVLLEGEIVLELDGGQQIPLKQHEIVVMHGGRHAWRNPGQRPAVLLFVLQGARRGDPPAAERAP